ANIGQLMAFIFGFIGLFGPRPLGPNPLLIFIAVFVWMGAAQEAGLAQMRSALGGVSVGQVMITDFHALSPQDTLSRAVEQLLAGWQNDFPVVEDGRVVGLLTRAALVNGLAKRGQQAP